MYEYMTRAMVARKPITYATQDLQPGDEFYATPVDADYFVKCGRAEDLVLPAATVEVAPVVVAPVIIAEPVIEAAPVVAEEAPAEQEPAAESAAEPDAVTPRRRGRPPRQAVDTEATE
jgi:hypothetical protein